jgi:lantibiotic biosynthesis protein
MTAKDDGFLQAADFLGRRLVRDALWAGPRCNWLGDSMEFVDNAWSVVHRALGPDFYGGTSGVALFLARLHQLTGERLFKVTAEGAATHALERAADIPVPGRLAFYGGWTGIAYALAEVGNLLDNGTLVARALALMDEVERDPGSSSGLDVIGGSAGAIPPLIGFHRRYDCERMLPLAVRLGEHLLTAARRSDAGWSWNTLEGQSQHDLTGFSHGAAGIAWALLELYAETGRTEFRDAAEQGFAYERQWFSNEQENWPDLRSMPGANPGGTAASFAMAWCHGAPGIGLSRLRGFEILKQEILKHEAQAAIRTSTRALDHAANAPQADFTLCHGRAGIAELLVYAGEALDDDASRAKAQAVGRQGLESFLAKSLPWPCGVPGGGETPNLMLGLAGIGYFYLRLYDPEKVTSVLLVRPPARAIERRRNRPSRGASRQRRADAGPRRHTRSTVSAP